MTALRALIYVVLLTLCSVANVAATPGAQHAHVIDLSEAAGSYALKADLSYLEDPAGQLRIEEVSTEPVASRFRQHPDRAVSFGNSQSAYWFKFTVRTGDTRQRWYLEIDFPPLDVVTFFSPTTAGTFAVLRSGDSIAFAERPFDVANHLFAIDLEDREPHTYYVRMTSSGSVTAPMVLYREQALRSSQDRQVLGAGMFFGCLIALGIYNMLLFFSVRDRSYIYYALTTILFCLLYVSMQGYGYQYLWPDSPVWNNHAPLVLAFWALAATVPFARSILGTSFNAPVLDRIFVASGLFAAIMGGLTLGILPHSIAFNTLSLTLFLYVPLLLAISILCVRRGVPLAKFFLLAWTPMILAALIYLMRAVTILPPNFLTIYGFQLGSALEMILLSFALAYRITQARRDKEAAQEALLRELQQSGRKLEEAVASRTGELHTANRALESEVAVRRHAEERLLHMAHHDPLTGLPNRALLKERFGQCVQQARRHHMMMAVLLLDLDGFKRVNDTMGHDVGDELLIAVGKLLQRSVRGTDTVARLGGDEFVVLMTEMTEEGAASEVAEKIILTLSEPVRTSEQRTLQAGASIGIALYPSDGEDLENLLRRADTAMYQAKGAGRMCYRYFSAPVASKEVLLRAVQRSLRSSQTGEP